MVIHQICMDCNDVNNNNNGENKDLVVSPEISKFLVENLIPGKKYSFYITGKNQEGLEGESSNKIVFTAGLKPNKLPMPKLVSFTISEINIKNEFTLSNIDTGGNAEHGLDIKKYILYKNGYKYYETTEKNKIEEYTFSNLVKGEEYHIQISCVNIIGESELSEKLIVTPSYYPSSPLNLKIISQSSTKIEISREEPLDNGGLPITSYEINIIKSGNNQVINKEINDTYFTFTNTDGIQKGVEYNIKVRAINKYAKEKLEINKYKWSETKKGYSMDIPSVVQDLRINDNYDRYSGTLSWTILSADIDKGYSNNIKYFLCVKYNNKNDIKEITNELNINNNNNNEYNYIFQVPFLGVKYSFKIIVKNEVGESESNEIEVLFNSKPKKMKSLILEEISVYRSDTPYIKLSWAGDSTNNVINELQNYKIYIKEENNNNIIKFYEIANIDTKEIIIFQSNSDNILLGNIYYFFISVKNNRGYSDDSDGLIVAFAEPPQNIAKENIKEHVCPNFIEIIWSIDNLPNGGSDITGFIIQTKLSINSNYEYFNATIGSDGNSYTNIVITQKGGISESYFSQCDSTHTTSSIPTSNFYSVRFYSLQKGSYYNFRIAAYNKFFTDINTLKFMEPLHILYATEPGKITKFEQNFENMKENQINLKWESPNDNGGAEILYYIISQKNGDNTYDLANLTKNINYYEIEVNGCDDMNYVIKSQNEAGISEESDVLTCHSGLKPGIVRNLKTISVKKDEIKIQFNEPENKNILNCQIIKYNIIYKIGESNEVSDYIVIDSTNNNNYYEFQLNLDNNYYSAGTKVIFKVKAINSVGDGETAELITYNCDNPSIPNLSIYKREEKAIIFSLTPNDNDLNLMKNNNNCRLTKLELYKDNEVVCNGSYKNVKCSVRNLENGSSYNFKLKYYNNVGGVSEEASIQNCKIGVKPNSITNISVDKITIGNDNKTQLDISWEKDESNHHISTYYYVYVLYALKDNEDYPNIDSNNENTYKTEYNYKNITELVKSQTYKIKVYAKNDIGEGEPYELSEIIIDSTPKIIEMSTVNTTCNSIKIKWEAESSQNYPIQTYFIYVNETKIEINNNNNNVLEYNITNLASGEIYNISISGNYSYGETNIIYKMIKACTSNRIIDCSITFNNNNTVNGNIYDNNLYNIKILPFHLEPFFTLNSFGHIFTLFYLLDLHRYL